MRKDENKTRSGLISKIIGVVLILGGLLGIASSVPMVMHFAHQNQVGQMISALLAIVLFAWGIPTGLGVWREFPRELKWAKIIFALQVPVFSIGRLVYQYSNFLSVRIMVGNTTHNFGGDVGSSSNLYLLPQSPGFMFGVNLFALIVLMYLIVRSGRQRHRESFV